MRDFFISTAEKLVVVFVALMVIAVVIAGFGAMFTGEFLMGVGILIGGAIYSVILGGMMFLGFGIHDGVQRTADALENK